MFKTLKQYHIQLTPFQAAKSWNLNNLDNDELLLFESTSSGDGDYISLEYIDYSSGVPENNASCLIALEQQEEDAAEYKEGVRGNGIFYPENEEINPDGTYKRVIWSQIKTAFYNDYRDPTKMWGVENIDFENGETKRRLADRLRMFDIPRRVYGDKIIPNTVQINDSTLDNDVVIEDDGKGNLILSRNMFSKQQEIGDFNNTFDNNTILGNCDSYFSGS